MLTDLRSILALAEEKGCAIPAFNCYTQEGVMGVLEAAKETGAPVIFQMFSRLADTNDGNFVAPAILEAIRQIPQPAVMHLDHGAGIPEVVRAIRLGMTGGIVISVRNWSAACVIPSSMMAISREKPRACKLFQDDGKFV